MDIKLKQGAVRPKRMTKHAAGYDLCAYKGATIPSKQRCKVPTGVHFAIPVGYVGTISHRSGMNANQDIQAYGRVDSDYQGEVFVTLFNTGDKPVRVEDGDRIAQIVFTKHEVVTFTEVKEFSFKTERGENGYGSTGTK